MADLGLVPAGEPGVRDWGYHAQRVAEAHLDLCEQWVAFYEEGDDYPKPDESDPSVGPFCGCSTCVVREVLAAAWPVMEAAVRSGDFEPKP